MSTVLIGELITKRFQSDAQRYCARLKRNVLEVDKIKLKTNVEFRSDKFPPYDGKEEEINPGLWGKRLAEYLQEHLPRHGVKVTCIGAEDWGWMVELENDEFPLWIGCGHQSGDDDEFLCFIEPSKPLIRKWFKKIDTTVQVDRVSRALNKVLESDINIRNIKWTSGASE